MPSRLTLMRRPEIRTVFHHQLAELEYYVTVAVAIPVNDFEYWMLILWVN